MVAHPPCQLWVNFAALNFKRYGGKPDAVRLSEAIGRSGLGVRRVATAAGLGHHSTVSQVLSGKLALAKAGGGALLAWVERQERA